LGYKEKNCLGSCKGFAILDDYCEAVVGDFGLAKLLDHQDSHVTTAVRGTVGHIAPEYLSTGQSSEKTDVFGFGILLLELISGQRALEFGKAANQKGVMLDWVPTKFSFIYCPDSRQYYLIHDTTIAGEENSSGKKA